MPTSPASFATIRFITVATEVANRLDFASRIPDNRSPLGEQLFAVKALWWDLRVSTPAAGLDGVPVVEAATVVRDQLATAVDAHDQDGNLDPWGRCRDRVREQLDRLRSIMPLDPIARPVVAQAVSVQPAAPRQSRDATGEKGERGEEVRADSPTTIVLDQEERTMLKTLLENDATSQADGSRLRREDVEEFGRMKTFAIRKAAKSLVEKGLITSFNDRRGGYWLTPEGIDAARGLVTPPKK